MEDFLCILLTEYLHLSKLILDCAFDLETISEEYITFLREDREDKFIIIFEAMREVIDIHDCIFHFFSEKCLFQKVIKLDLIELTDDEYIDDIIRSFIAEIEDGLRDSDEIEIFASLKKFFYRIHHIIRLEIHISYLLIYETVPIHRIELFFILLIRLQYSEILEIHEFATYSIDLLVCIAAELTYEKSSTIFSYCIFDDEFFEELHAWAWSEEFDEIQGIKKERILKLSIWL